MLALLSWFLVGVALGLFGTPFCGLILLGSVHVISGLWREQKGRGLFIRGILFYQIVGMAVIAVLFPALFFQKNDPVLILGSLTGAGIFVFWFSRLDRAKKKKE